MKIIEEKKDFKVHVVDYENLLKGVPHSFLEQATAKIRGLGKKGKIEMGPEPKEYFLLNTNMDIFNPQHPQTCHVLNTYLQLAQQMGYHMTMLKL